MLSWLNQQSFGDHRGFFTESYSQEDFKAAGLDYAFVQDNHSLSVGSRRLTGLTLSKGEAAQTKLIRVVTGAVLDVIVDIRKGSPDLWSMGRGILFLSESNHRQLLVPKGFAHGFVVTLTPNVNFLYKCDNYYNAQADAGIAFDDPDLAIDWPIAKEQAILSEKDQHHPTLQAFEAENPFVYGEI